MQKIKCIIIEDEPLAVKILSDYIAQVPDLELRGSFREAISAGVFLQKEKTDLLFLDIHLPKIKGLTFLKTLSNPPAVIVTSAYHQYAVEGFDLNVTDYLLKPIAFERFLAAVNKAIKQLSAAQTGNPEEKQADTSVFLTINRRKVKIFFNDILYAESLREYVKVVTVNGEYITKMSTTELESLLPSSRFRRIHRSFIVSLDKIQAYTKEEVDIAGIRIPVGKGYRKELSLD